MRTRFFASLGLTTTMIGGALIACTGDDSSNPPLGGKDAAADQTVDQTTPDATPDTGGGDAGADAADASPYSPRAQRGLDISPVPLTTTGLSTAQIEQIGQGSYLVNAVATCGDCHNVAG